MQQIAGASLGEGVAIWIEIDPKTSTLIGFTGCNAFSAVVAAFGQGISVSAIEEERGECPSAAAATDEARFLGVLPHVQRRIRHGLSLQLLRQPQGSEALLQLRRAEAD